ncbi:MAG TPA: dienelactone hydrolase family protein, partial [Polyangiaceae bacterium]|nr:dienelactone hydrolase family protein [Polyangiaceae bacterium]
TSSRSPSGGSSSAVSESPSGGSSTAISSSSASSGPATSGGSTTNPDGTGGTSARGGTKASASGGASTSGTRATTNTGGTSGKTTGTTTGGASRTGGAGGTNGSSVANEGGGTSQGGAGEVQACASPLPPVTDYTALAGPFPTTAENNTGPDNKTVIYRPKTLGENGFLHAPIIFGPGIGMQASQLSGLLTSFASHGYVVVGTAVLNGGPNDPANLATMRNALKWILQQNEKAGSVYQGKLATKCAISMGYSVGGTAAVEMGDDPAVATTVSIHGHTASSAMHGPLLQTSGDKDTVGRPMQQKTFDSSKVQTFFGTVAGADHGYIQSANGGVERHAIIAWMRYWINGDTGAKKYFWGDTCICCASPWMDPKRKNWQ